MTQEAVLAACRVRSVVGFAREVLGRQMDTVPDAKVEQRVDGFGQMALATAQATQVRHRGRIVGADV